MQEEVVSKRNLINQLQCIQDIEPIGPPTAETSSINTPKMCKMAATTDYRNGSLRMMIWGNIQGATTPAAWRARMQEEKKLEPCMRIATQSAKDRQGKLADRYGYLPTRSPSHHISNIDGPARKYEAAWCSRMLLSSRYASRPIKYRPKRL